MGTDGGGDLLIDESFDPLTEADDVAGFREAEFAFCADRISVIACESAVVVTY